MMPHFRGLRVGRPFKTYDGASVVSVENSAGTTMFLVLTHMGQDKRVRALIAEFNALSNNGKRRAKK